MFADPIHRRNATIFFFECMSANVGKHFSITDVYQLVLKVVLTAPLYEALKSDQDVLPTINANKFTLS